MVNFTTLDEATERLTDLLSTKSLKSDETMLMAISEVGVMMCEQMSKTLKVTFDFFLLETITAPLNSECEIAVVSESMDIVTNDPLINAFNISWDYVYGEAKRTYDEEIISARYKYKKGENIKNIKNKNIIIVDQGINTGLSMNAAIKSCISLGAKQVFVASPVISTEAKNIIKEISDGLYFVFCLDDFVSTEHYYDEKITIDEENIESILEQEKLRIKNQNKGNKWK